MDQQELGYLFKKYFDKTATSSEVKALMENIHLASDEEIELLMKSEFEKYYPDNEFFNPHEKERILTAVFKNEKPVQRQSLQGQMMSNSLYFKYAGIAAVLFLTFAIGILSYKKAGVRDSINVMKTSAIAAGAVAPGSNKAILTISDGTSISLDGKQRGEIALETGFTKTSVNNGQLIYTALQQDNYTLKKEPVYHTVSTPRGGQFQVILPDGTKVWLNSASSIKYPAHFSNAVRAVVLQGEAYFEVAKNENIPFKVYTDKQVVKVLGTHFNMNSYDGDAVKTTLLEGSVEVSATEIEAEMPKRILKPGDQAVFINNKLTVAKVNVANAISWKSGFFQFENTDLTEVMDQFSRWYDADFEFEGEIPDTKLWGRFSRNVNMAEALAILTYFNFKYKIDQKDIDASKRKIIIYQ